MSPEEDRTRDAVDSEPKHYQLSYSGPVPSLSHYAGQCSQQSTKFKSLVYLDRGKRGAITASPVLEADALPLGY